MIDDEINFYKQEKLKFNELLNKLNWTEECLLQQQETLIQCPINREHRFPIGSKHLQKCQLVHEGFSKEYFKELTEYEQEKKLLKQSDISFTPLTLSNIIHRPITMINNIPLNDEQTTVLLTPNERLLITEAVHNEALRLKIVPSTPFYSTDNTSIQTQTSKNTEQINKLIELRNQKRRRSKYVTRTTKKNFYDIAREMINTQMNIIQQTQHDENQVKQTKHKHRSSSSKRKHRSNSHDKTKHHRHSKKKRKH